MPEFVRLNLRYCINLLGVSIFSRLEKKHPNLCGGMYHVVQTRLLMDKVYFMVLGVREMSAVRNEFFVRKRLLFE